MVTKDEFRSAEVVRFMQYRVECHRCMEPIFASQQAWKCRIGTTRNAGHRTVYLCDGCHGLLAVRFAPEPADARGGDDE